MNLFYNKMFFLRESDPLELCGIYSYVGFIYYIYVGLITLCGELMSHYKKKIAVKVILHKIFGGWDLSYMINYLISCLSFYLTLLA